MEIQNATNRFFSGLNSDKERIVNLQISKQKLTKQKDVENKR